MLERALAVLDRESEAITGEGSALAALGSALEQALGKDLQLLGVALLSATAPNELSALVRGACSLFAIDAGTNLVRDLLVGKGRPTFEPLTLPLRADQRVRYIAAPAGSLNIGGLKREIGRIVETDTRRDWLEIAKNLTHTPDFTLCVFPVLSALSFQSAAWPYDPFAGSQEERSHERRGLSEIASALFRDPSFRGFRLLPTPVFFKDFHSRIADGVLVSPWGVALLEIKDHRGRIILHDREQQGMECFSNWPREQTSPQFETNPVHKMVPLLRRMSSLPALKPISKAFNGWLTRTGAVVFTNPNVEVLAADGAGALRAVTHFGEVVVARPRQLSEHLKNVVRAVTGVGIAPPVDVAAIEQIVEHVLGRGKEQLPRPSRTSIGFYELINEPIEQTPYATLFEGTARSTGKRVWIRRVDALSLLRADKERGAALAALRENVALQEHLPPDPRLQRVLATAEHEHELYVVVEPADEPRLLEWLDNEPPREARVALLKGLSQVLALLGEYGVVHRALGSSTIRVRANAQPILTNFELCRLDSVATLPALGRNALDRAYLAPEADRPGAQIGPPADVYSLGRIAALVLSGKLPGATYIEQASWEREANAFPTLAKACGLRDDGVLRRMLSFNPSERPESCAISEYGWD